MDQLGWTVRSDEARRDFRVLLNSVEHDGAHVTIARYNTPAAVMVPVEWYERVTSAQRPQDQGEGTQ